MDLVPMVFSSGWASGVNSYLVVLILGLSDRFGHFASIPNSLGHLDVLIAAGILFVVEFVADKIPYIDSTWDAVSTVLRPVVAAGIGASAAAGHGHGSLEQLGYAALAAGTALASHSVKAGTRLAINASPEPLTNIGASLSEDGVVAVVALLILHHPWIALSVTAVLLILGLVLLVWLMRKVRRGWRRWKGKPVKPRRVRRTADTAEAD